MVLAELDRFPIAAKNNTRIAGIGGHQLLAATLALLEQPVSYRQVSVST